MPAHSAALRTRPPADRILHNGTIGCGRELGVVEMLGIRRSRALAAGPDANIVALAGPGTNIMGPDGRVVHDRIEA
ncbi:MAG: hypothetical protein ACREFP_21515 [Acetobacteraceae bacterium]